MRRRTRRRPAWLTFSAIANSVHAPGVRKVPCPTSILGTRGSRRIGMATRKSCGRPADWLGHASGTASRQKPDSAATSRKDEERRLHLFSQVRRRFCWSECVVRGGVEPPTFRFSVLRTTVRQGPPQAIRPARRPSVNPGELRRTPANETETETSHRRCALAPDDTARYAMPGKAEFPEMKQQLSLRPATFAYSAATDTALGRRLTRLIGDWG
jgi:hypothetical protein